MIQITPQMRILVATAAVDFRKGIDGLARLCRQELQADPFSGWMFVFRNRRATTLKVLVYDGQGFQCAFCMTGFIMAATGFLKVNPNPTRAEMAHGISGNLCRCADYNKILDVMMVAAENMRRA